jgi:hypothetical protein
MAEPRLDDEETILRAVHSWTRERQLALVRRLLDTGLDTLDPATQRPRIPSGALRDLATARRPAPSDEEIERWRQEKYDWRQE